MHPRLMPLSCLLIICLAGAACSRHECDSNVTVSAGTAYQAGSDVASATPSEMVGTIPLAQLPDWVRDPTMNGRYKGAYGFCEHVSDPLVLREEMAMRSARERFSAMYGGAVPAGAKRATYVDPRTGTLFVWLIVDGG